MADEFGYIESAEVRRARKDVLWEIFYEMKKAPIPDELLQLEKNWGFTAVSDAQLSRFSEGRITNPAEVRGKIPVWKRQSRYYPRAYRTRDVIKYICGRKKS